VLLLDTYALHAPAFDDVLQLLEALCAPTRERVLWEVDTIRRMRKAFQYIHETDRRSSLTAGW
jgi:hypothetical protein